MKTAMTVVAGILGMLLLATDDAEAHYPSVNRHAVFNGSSYFSVPNSHQLNGTLSQGGMASIDAWIYPTSYANYPTIVGNAWSYGYWFGLSTQGYLRFYPGAGIAFESKSTVPLKKWTHVAVAFHDKDDEVRFYIDGTLDRTVTGVNVQLGSSNEDLRIGADRQGTSPSYHFTGRIDEVRIWSAALNFASTDGPLHRMPQQYAGGQYGSRLVAAWRLNGDGADSAGGHNAAAVGAVSFEATPAPPHPERICAALINTGGNSHDFFSIPSAPSNNFASSYSIEAWVRPNTGGAASSFQTIICKGSAVAPNFSYWLGINKQNNRLRFAPTGAWGSAVESSDPLPSAAWTHVCAVYDFDGKKGEVRLYLNGTLKGGASFSGSAPPTQTDLLIGTGDQQYPPAQAYAYSGRIDEVRLWSTARTSAEIANSFRQEFHGNIAGLSGAYHFDGDILDHSQYSNHGVNSNSGSLGMYFTSSTDLPGEPSLAVKSPNGGESRTIGQKADISWAASGLGSVLIEISRDGGATYTETIATGANAAAGAHSWTTTGPETKSARIRIRTGTAPELSDESDATFSIVSPPPIIAASPGAAVFSAPQNGALPGSRDISLSNTGPGTLSWNASWAAAWLDASPAAGTGNSAGMAVSVTTTALAAGVYRDTILLTGNAGNMPFSIPVEYTVTATPRFEALPPSLQFATQPGITPPQKNAHILNVGSGKLSWTAAATSPWISLSPNAGSGGDSIAVTINPTGLAVGSHQGGIQLSGNADNSPFLIPVELIISTSSYYPVSGRVETGARGIGGVRVAVSGDSTFDVFTNRDGNFSIPALRAGAYTVAAHSPYYSFAPAQYFIPALTGPRDDLVFSAKARPGEAMLGYRQGWNLISLPIEPANPGIASLLPDADPPRAWRYAPDTGYVETTVLEFGAAYWVKFRKSDSIRITGTLRGDLLLSLTGSGGGWNMVGAASGTVRIAEIPQAPPGSVVHVFQFIPGQGYRIPADDLISPGKGYFIKVRNSATLYLQAGESP